MWVTDSSILGTVWCIQSVVLTVKGGLAVPTQQQQQLFYGHRDYAGELVLEETPTHHPDHHPVFISFFHLPRSVASSLFKLRAWQSFCTTSFHVLFGLPLGLEPSVSYSIRFFTQSVSLFCSTCPYHRSCNQVIF